MSSVADTDIYDAIVAAYQSMPQEQRDKLRRRDVHDRIRSVLDMAPASSWNLEESQMVLEALYGILLARQATGKHT
jgi:hypothetical protein